MTRAGASFCLAFLFSLPAFAHKASDAYLALSVQGARVDAQWDIALRDLAEPVGADLDGDGRITWGELRGREQALAAWALSRLDVAADGRPCLAGPTQLLVDSHSDGAYAVLRFSLQCPAEPAALAVGYRLLFDTDAQHRGLLRLEARGETRTAVFGPATSEQRFDLAATRPLAQMATFVREGIHHIWSGFDHLLFLIALLLPAVLRRQDGRWVPVASFRPALQDAAKVVTAFTVAHSLTLTLAALDVVRLPSRLVEAGIALSVAVAAIDNLRPIFQRLHARRWAVAFAFGLLHGFGFAGALVDLALPRQSLVRALFSFNLGVELGQLAIVLAFLQLAYAVRNHRAYQRVALQAGSAAIAMLAFIWFIERATGLAILRLA